jgi:cytochrome b6-f complex iron-sulfur subunit
MTRKEFLAQMGIGATGALMVACLGGCSKASNPAPAPVNFTLDLNLPANAALGQNGGYVYSNGVIVAKTMSGNLIAVSQACTHQGVTVVYDNQNNVFFCSAHGSAFNTSGAVVNGPANSPLRQYTVSTSGNIVTITG